MTLKDHIVFGAAASLALYPTLGHMSFFFWAASVMIDADHYLDYVYHNGFRDLSLRGMFSYHDYLMKRWHGPEFLNVEVFHTVEFIAPIYLLGILSGSIFIKAVAWGLIFHNMLDAAYLVRHGIFFKRAYSLTEYFIRKKRLSGRGLSPDGLYMEAARAACAPQETLERTKQARLTDG